MIVSAGDVPETLGKLSPSNLSFDYRLPVFGKGKTEFFMGRVKGHGVPCIIRVDRSRNFRKICDIQKRTKPLVNLSDSNIVAIFSSHIDYDDSQHVHYLVMGTSNAPTLSALISERMSGRDKVTEDQLLRLMRQLIRGCAKLETLSCAHGALCPQNIALENGQPVLINFFLQDECQSLNYTSPQVYQRLIKSKPLDDISLSQQDVYSLGLCFLELATLKSVKRLSYGQSLSANLEKVIAGLEYSRFVKDLFRSMLAVANRPYFQDLLEQFFPDEPIDSPRLEIMLSPIHPASPVDNSLEEADGNNELFKSTYLNYFSSNATSILVTNEPSERSFFYPRFSSHANSRANTPPRLRAGAHARCASIGETLLAQPVAVEPQEVIGVHLIPATRRFVLVQTGDSFEPRKLKSDFKFSASAAYCMLTD